MKLPVPPHAHSSIIEGPVNAAGPQLIGQALDGLVLMAKVSLALLVAGIAGCTHTGEKATVPRAELGPATCFRPGAREFVSPLPPGMTLEEGLARGIIGSLDKEGIHRIIRGNLGEVRACYERTLAQQPGLSGRVVIQFVITGNGKVSDSRLSSSTLGAVEAEVCIAERPCNWQFPQTNGGGPVIVTYPFVLNKE
jgi:hypothetical protein